MALLSRLHWWTVEYGLIGTLEKPKIYGAGLLSSIGESVSCLEPHVKKIALFDRRGRNGLSTSRRSSRSSLSAAISSISAMCWKNSRARWRSWSVVSKESTRRSSARILRPASIHPGLQVSGVFSEVLTDREWPADLSANDRTDRARLSETRNCRDTGATITRMVSVRRSDGGRKPS